MKPILAHIYEPHRVTYPCFVQPKLNGIRALYQNGCFQSRDELPFPKGLLDHIAKQLAILPPDWILDGELYKHGWPLQRINGAVTPVRQQPNEDTLQVEYHIFDRVQFDSSFIHRAYNTLQESIGYIRKEHIDPKVSMVLTAKVDNEQKANYRYVQFVEDKYEGMMYRLGDCPYTVPKQPGGKKFLSDKDNRTWHLLKRKSWCDDEFFCCAVVEGEGKLRGMLGAVVCHAKTNLLRFSVGSGLTDAERQHYWANPPIGQMIKVKYLVLSSDGIPLNPTILCINPK